jgi:outer membrane protein TolC
MPIALAFTSDVFAQQPPTLPNPKTAPIPAPTPFASEVITRYTLAEALAIGHARHPQLAALNASKNAALMKQRGLDEVKRMAEIITPDLKYRQQQSDLGLKAAIAEYEQAKHEVTFAVVSCYYSVVYAREQSRVTKNFVDDLDENLARLKKIVEGKGGTKEISQNTVDKLVVAIGEARKKMILAETGTDRARAALREAMGLEPGARVDAADEVLPEIRAEIDRDTVIAHAITRRGEIQLVQIGADVTRLEACAQWARRLAITAYTYAIAADIHARPVPPSQRDPDYKPGAIGPEMPTRLLGNNDTRSKTAALYADRALSAVDQARSVICLEAENAYYRWVESVRNVKSSREAAQAGKKLIDRLREAAGGTLTKEDVLISEIAATQAQASFNEALYEQIVNLANLERITAGGVRVNFPGR